MKYVTKYKSPNYDSRKNSNIRLIIIHYTALNSAKDAILYLCKKEKKVSSHYFISQQGIVYNLVKEKYRAWHAGQSFWHDVTDINSISIGIELDYSPYGKNNFFSLQMISSLKKILLKIQNKYNISKKNILAHSDVAPFRKKDPGKYFPWKSLYNSNIIQNINKVKKNEIIVIEEWFSIYKINSNKRRLILALSILGYDTRRVYKDTKLYKKLINAYKIRYLNEVGNNNNKKLYDIIIGHLKIFLLTKN